MLAIGFAAGVVALLAIVSIGKRRRGHRRRDHDGGGDLLSFGDGGDDGGDCGGDGGGCD